MMLPSARHASIVPIQFLILVPGGPAFGAKTVIVAFILIALTLNLRDEPGVVFGHAIHICPILVFRFDLTVRWSKRWRLDYLWLVHCRYFLSLTLALLY